MIIEYHVYVLICKTRFHNLEMMLIKTFLQEYGLMWMFDGNLKVNQQPKLKLIFLYIPIKKIATAFTHFLLLLVLYKYCLIIE